MSSTVPPLPEYTSMLSPYMLPLNVYFTISVPVSLGVMAGEISQSSPLLK